MEIVGSFLAIRWDDGGESILGLEELRRNCQCARCAGEVDVTGRLHRMGPPPVYTPASFELAHWEPMGNYAVQLRWGDGHDTGIFPFERLRALGQDEDGADPDAGSNSTDGPAGASPTPE
jgi:DUF971 family protein